MFGLTKTPPESPRDVQDERADAKLNALLAQPPLIRDSNIAVVAVNRPSYLSKAPDPITVAPIAAPVSFHESGIPESLARTPSKTVQDRPFPDWDSSLLSTSTVSPGDKTPPGSFSPNPSGASPFAGAHSPGYGALSSSSPLDRGLGGASPAYSLPSFRSDMNPMAMFPSHPMDGATGLGNSTNSLLVPPPMQTHSKGTSATSGKSSKDSTKSTSKTRRHELAENGANSSPKTGNELMSGSGRYARDRDRASPDEKDLASKDRDHVGLISASADSVARKTKSTKDTKTTRSGKANSSPSTSAKSNKKPSKSGRTSTASTATSHVQTATGTTSSPTTPTNHTHASHLTINTQPGANATPTHVPAPQSPQVAVPSSPTGPVPSSSTSSPSTPVNSTGPNLPSNGPPSNPSASQTAPNATAATTASRPNPLAQPVAKKHPNTDHQRTSATPERAANARPDPDELLKWKKGALLGRGAYGSVFLGLTDKGLMIAVKELLIAPEMDSKQRAQLDSFKKEIDIMKDFNHPNIVCYLGSAMTDQCLYILLEYVPGGSISSILAKFGPLSENLIRIYAQQILVALDYLHANNVVHRDIKGANILVGVRGEAKLADFGCSKSIQGLVSQDLNTMQGTPFWMAPEVMRQAGHGPPADIWSFGCTMIEMADGKPPFSEYTAMPSFFFDVLMNEKLPQIPDHLSPEAKQFIFVCTQINPKLRPKPKDLLQHAWVLSTSNDDSQKKNKDDAMTMPAELFAMSQSLNNLTYTYDLMPPVVAIHIIKFLDHVSFSRLGRVSTNWQSVVNRNSIWLEKCVARWPKLCLSPPIHVLEYSVEKSLSSSQRMTDWKNIFKQSYCADRRMAKPLQMKTGHVKVSCLHYLSDSNQILVADEKSVKVIPGPSCRDDTEKAPKKNATKQTLFEAPHSSTVRCLTANSDESLLASGGDDSVVNVWSLHNQDRLSLTGHATGTRVTCVRFGAPNELISGDVGGAVKLWDLEKSACVRSLPHHTKSVTDLLVIGTCPGAESSSSNHAQCFLSASEDGSIAMWDRRREQEVLTWSHAQAITCLGWTGHSMLCGAEGVIREWKITSSKECDDAFPIRSALSPAKPSPTASNGRHARSRHELLSLQFASPNAIFTATAGGLYQALDYNTRQLYWETSLLPSSQSGDEVLAGSSGSAMGEIVVHAKASGLCVIKLKDKVYFFDPFG